VLNQKTALPFDFDQVLVAEYSIGFLDPFDLGWEPVDYLLFLNQYSSVNL
jgi:hypothetical protein